MGRGKVRRVILVGGVLGRAFQSLPGVFSPCTAIKILHTD